MKPILFNTEMVRSILKGRKTVTRRNPFQMPNEYNRIKGLYRDGKNRLCAIFQCTVPEDPTIEEVYARYQPGDILWVRETWSISDGAYLYRAFPGVGMEPEKQDAAMREMGLKWHPSIHMPREAARIFLRVSNVRVERLQDITPEQGKAEGVGSLFVDACAYDEKYKDIPWVQNDGLDVHQFARLWDSTIKQKDRPTYGWEANPWVWVIEFERITKEDAEKE